jgi:DNA-binding transcriptional MerR regulator
MEEQNVFSKKDVSRLLELNPATVAFYTREGIVIPAVANPQGRGTTRLYSKLNLLEFLLVKKLAGFGFNLEKIEKILNSARNWGLGSEFEEGVKLPSPWLDFLERLNSKGHENFKSYQYLVVYEANNDVIAYIDEPPAERTAAFQIDLDLEGKDAVLIINIGELIKKVIDL